MKAKRYPLLKRLKTNKIKSYILAVLIGSCSFEPLFGEDLLAVYNYAVQSDPISIAAKLDMLISEEQQQQALAHLYPQASLTGSLSENRLSGSDIDRLDYSGQSLKFNVSQTLFDLQAWRENDKFKLLLDKSSNDYQQAQNVLMVKIVELYFDALQAKDALVLSKKNRSTIGKNLEQLKALFKKQLVAITGVYEAEARYDLALSTIIEAEAAYFVAMENLYKVIGERVEVLATLSQNMLFPELEESVDVWLEWSQEKNPTLLANKSNIQAMQKEVDVRSAAYAPKFTLGFIQSHQDTGFDNSPRPKTDTSTIALSFSQPLYQGGGLSSKKRESLHRLNLAKQAQIESQRNIDKELREHYLNLKADTLKIKATERRIFSESKRAESMQASFKYGTVTVNDVLNAETDFLKAQLDHQKAKYNYIKNLFRLKSVAGVITEQEMYALNKNLN